MTPEVRIYKTLPEVAKAGADILVELGRECVEQDIEGFVALSGGSTPTAMYRELVSRNDRDAKALRRLHYFFGDERNVDNFNAESNVRNAVENFLVPMKVAYSHARTVDGSVLPLESEAVRLTRVLEQDLPRTRTRVPQFDLVFLGMGDDGHTASLFPGTDALHSTHAGFVANEVPQLRTSRLTLTYPVINAASQVVVMCAGESKAEMLGKVFSTKPSERYPVQLVQAKRMIWLVDEAAAAQLPDSARGSK